MDNVLVQGVWLRRIGNEVQVLVEVDMKWHMAIIENVDDNFSHIVEPSGIIAGLVAEVQQKDD